MGIAHAHDELEPGDDCPTCGRRIPSEKKDAPTGKKRSRITITEPPGMEGELELLLIGLVDKDKDQWPREFAAMRDGIGLEVVGASNWRFYALHFAAYAALTVPGLAPVEEDQPEP